MVDAAALYVPYAGSANFRSKALDWITLQNQGEADSYLDHVAWSDSFVYACRIFSPARPVFSESRLTGIAGTGLPLKFWIGFIADIGGDSKNLEIIGSECEEFALAPNLLDDIHVSFDSSPIEANRSIEITFGPLNKGRIHCRKLACRVSHFLAPPCADEPVDLLSPASWSELRGPF